MGRIEEIRQRRAELSEQIPAKTAELQTLLAEDAALEAEEAKLMGRRGRHLHAVKDERNVLVLLLMAVAALARFRPQRLALAASSSAVVGTTVVALTLGAPAMLRPSATARAPEVVYVPVTRLPASPTAPSAAPTVRASQPPPSRPVAPPVAPTSTPPAAAPTAPSSGPSLPVSLPSLPIPSASLPVPPVPVPTVTVTAPGTPSPTGTCLIVVNLRPVLGACVL